jgi:hypothetical protein
MGIVMCNCTSPPLCSVSRSEEEERMTSPERGNRHREPPHGPGMAGSRARWRKSSYSNHQSNCVEIAELGPETVGFRDSKDPLGPVLAFPAGAVREFVGAAARGEFPFA